MRHTSWIAPTPFRRRLTSRLNAQMTPRWHILVAEAQFATELTVAGLRRLCLVPCEIDLERWVGDDRNYALHVGMHSYASGLERLCKLAIACHGFLAMGEFPRTKRFSHGLGGLLDAVGLLDPMPDVSEPKGRYLTRPTDGLDPDLTEAVERYANGPGRYEHLDSLWNPDVEVNMYRTWVSLCGRSELPDGIEGLVSTQAAVAEAVAAELSHAGLESSGSAVVEDLGRRVSLSSVGVALSLFRKARWVSSIIDETTYYTHQDLPILGEAVGVLRSSSRNFYAYEIARLSDVDAVEDELTDVLPRVHERWRAEDEAEESAEPGV
jgi:hypothetical protein